MAEKKSGLKKKYGPLTGGAWLATAGGVLATWWLIRRYAASKAAAAQQSSSTLAGGNTIPAGQSAADTGASSTPAAAAGPTDLESWTQAALKEFPRDPIVGLNAIQQWMSGNCVSHTGYVGIGRAIDKLGLPPYMQTFPVLSICPGSTEPAPPPATPTPPATPVPPTVTPTTPPATLPNTPLPVPTLQPPALWQVLRDVTLANQAKAAAANNDPNGLWANFGALALDFQNNPSVAPTVIALENQPKPAAA